MGAIATVAMAFAVGACVVSAAYGLYAVLRMTVSPAEAAGLTALAAAILASILAFVLTRLKGQAPPAAKPSRVDPKTLDTAMAVGTAIAGLTVNVVRAYRAKRKQSKPDKRSRKRK